MAREISRAEAWERAHEVFAQVNFNAFDYNSIKESLLDYVKLYFPEDFNDYIESSEFIAILELFAYVGELLAYRIDLNAHENFITTAERKESILRLAKLISYKASRNIPARGLVKMTSIQTTETVIDSAGRNLAGRRIYWNDNNNPDWKEQFLLVLNRIFEQEFGTVTPDERVQVNDVLFELYSLDNNPFGANTAATIPFTADAGGVSAPMEVVPLQLTDDGPIERRPETNAKFTLVYANDGLGDSSDTTGFLMYVKQGQLVQQTATFDGVTPNQNYEININNINETDLWVNNVDPVTGEILTDDPYADLMPHLVADDLRYGEWIEVDLANAQNIIFNTNKNRHKYEVETLDNDQIRIVFGDGEFSDIPSGAFQLWYRTSLNQDYIIEKTAVIDQLATVAYTDAIGAIQTITFTFSLTTSLQNASASEDIEHIRRVAPSVYYTQDRMVNGRDYNVFMLQDPSILKLRALNRTFAGDSKYIAWHDPRENYEDVKLFGDDMSLYWKEEDPTNGGFQTVNISTSANAMIENVIEPLLSSMDFFAKIAPKREALGLPGGKIRTYFNNATVPYSFGVDGPSGTDNEIDAISYQLNNFTSPFNLYYSVLYNEWTVGPHPNDGTDADSDLMISVDQNYTGTQWVVTWRTRRLIAQSTDTRFWNTNTTEQIVNYDTINSNTDRIVILKANTNASETGLLDANKNYNVLAQELIEDNTGNLPDTERLSIIPEDVNGDDIPDNILQSDLFTATYTRTWGELRNTDTEGQYFDLAEFGRQINNSTDKGLDNDIKVTVNGIPLTYSNLDLLIGAGDVNNLVITKVYIRTASLPAVTDTVVIELPSYVYFYREDDLSPWHPIEDTETNRVRYLSEDPTLEQDDLRYDRRSGRYPLNFAWFHYTPRLSLVDPSASNIIDSYIITKGYYTAMTRWLSNATDVEPIEPTPRELRSSYSELLDNKMISDTVILHSGRFKILFGSRAIPQLRAVFKVVRPQRTSKTDNQVKVEIVSAIRAFFDIETWEFGETFFFTELAASIHVALGPEIDSILLVPEYAQNQFGDLLQVSSQEDEVFIPDISTSDVEIVEAFTPDNLRFGSAKQTTCEPSPCTVVIQDGVGGLVCADNSPVAGEAVAGCMIPGNPVTGPCSSNTSIAGNAISDCAIANTV